MDERGPSFINDCVIPGGYKHIWNIHNFATCLFYVIYSYFSYLPYSLCF
jgi:hypothetical protein